MKKVMKKLLFVSLFVLALSCLFAFSLTASAEVYSGECGNEGDDVIWQLDTETGVLTLSGEGTVSGVGYSDFEESCWYEYRDLVRKVAIGENITIDENFFSVFYDLEELQLADNTAVGTLYGEFEIKNIIVGDNVIIGESAFYGCYGTEEITVGDNAVIAARGFGGCYSLKNLTVGDNATIGESAFCDCNEIKTIIIGDSAVIGDYVFWGSYELTKVTLGDNVSVGASAFSDGMMYENYISLEMGTVKNASEGAFRCCILPNTVVIADNAVIGDYAFEDYSDGGDSVLKKVVIGDNVSLGDYAFDENKRLATVEVNGKFSYIGSNPFYGTKIYKNAGDCFAIDGALIRMSGWTVFVDDVYYIVAKDAIYGDAYFACNKSKWDSINCGDEDAEDCERHFNHEHNYAIEYSYNSEKMVIYCEKCEFEGSPNDTKVKNLKAEATESKVTLTWDGFKNAEGYTVFVRDTVNNKWIDCTEKGKFPHEDLEGEESVWVGDMESVEFTIDGLEPYTDYKFAVRAYVIKYDWENEIIYAPKFETVTVKTKLGKPEVTGVGGIGCAGLTWTEVEGADGYRVYQKVNGSWKTLAYTKNLSYLIKNLTNGASYSFAVKAYELIDGKKVYAPKYDDVTVKVQLSNPKVTYERGIDSITLNWDKVITASGYRVYRYVDGKWKAIKTTTGTSYTFTGLKNNTKYNFAVRSYVKVNGATKWASSYTKVTVTTLDYTPIKATGLKGEILSTTSHRISWNKSEDAVGYYLYKYNSSTKKYVVVAKTKNLSAVIEDIDATKNSYYVIKTYKYVDGKVKWSGYSAKLKVMAVPDKKEAVRLYNEITMQGNVWFDYNMASNKKICDYSKRIKYKGYTYAPLIHKKINTVDAYKKHMYKFYDKKIVDQVADDIFLVKNGKTYVGDASAGGAGTLDLSKTEFIGYTDFSDNKISYKVKWTAGYYEDDEYISWSDEETITIIQQDGRWVYTADEFYLIIGSCKWPGSNYNPYDV